MEKETTRRETLACRGYVAPPITPSHQGSIPPSEWDQLKDALRAELKQEIQSQVFLLGKTIAKEICSQLQQEQALAPRRQVTEEGSPSETLEKPSLVGQCPEVELTIHGKNKGIVIVEDRSTVPQASVKAWDKAFAICKRIQAPEEPLQVMARLTQQSPISIPPRTEMIVWTVVSHVAGSPDHLVLLEDLPDDTGAEERGWRVARTLTWARGGKVPTSRGGTIWCYETRPQEWWRWMCGPYARAQRERHHRMAGRAQNFFQGSRNSSLPCYGSGQGWFYHGRATSYPYRH
ncbi:unnamed protein product [Arctogadus glacialis]